MEIIKVNQKNIDLLGKFLSNELPYNFRYYISRDYNKILDNHVLTVLGLVEDEPVAYAHIDKERGINWVGVCVLSEYQGNGYGKTIFKYLMDYAVINELHELHLTVDRNNALAFNMYVKFGFEIERIFIDKVAMVYNHGNQVVLPLSPSESFDKLSQLEVLISSGCKPQTRLIKQYNDIYLKLEPFMDYNVEFHYNILKEINLQIFTLRNKDNKSLTEYQTLEQLDDRLPRIRRKIDALLSSKRYNIKLNNKKNKRGFLLGHLGLGDLLTNIGIIRYLTTIYDELIYVVFKRNFENAKIIFKDEPAIKLHAVSDDNEIYMQMFDKEKFKNVVGEEDIEILTLGYHNIKKPMKDIKVDLLPFCFHDDIGLPYDIFWTYFHVPETEATFDLCRVLLKNKTIDYIFIHNHYSGGKVFESSLVEKFSGKSKNDTLFINVNVNEYEKGHRFYEIAEVFVNRPLLDYRNIIINASYIFVTNSSFFCMSINLPIKTDNCYYVSTMDMSYLYDDKHYFDKVKDSRKIFKQIKDY
jgi:GNAT superfamily N-acetyltransferase